MTGRRTGHEVTYQCTAALSVRTARPAEHPRIGQLSVAAYRADQQLEPGSRYESVLANVADRAAAGELLVAEDPATGQLLGSVLYLRADSRYAELSGPEEAEFRMLAVDPAAQGRGVGEALVRACLQRASRQGCRAVVIYTRDFAVAAQRLYRRLGFVRTPERDASPAPGIRLWALRRELGPPWDPLPGPGTGAAAVGQADAAAPATAEQWKDHRPYGEVPP